MKGKRIGDEALAPGWTKYSTRVFYVVYDVMQYIEATNVLGAIVGIGRRNTTAFRPLDNVSSSDTVPMIFRLKLVLTYDSDVESYDEIMVSSTDWRAASSPVVSSSIYNGEVYDARLEKARWNEVGYKLDDSWKQVAIVSGPQGIMPLQLIPPIKQDPPNPPIDIQTLPGNIYVLDFGTNLAGYCRLTVKGDKGQVIVLKHAEVKLHPPYGPRNGSLYYANLRSAEATDTYILRGDPQGETYKPYFTYHGFRYVEVRGYPGKLEAGNLQQIPIHADVDAVKTLNTSSLIMNDLQAVVKNSHLSNFLSIVTGCAQRDERIGWMGDAGLSCDIMALGFDMHAFFVNMLRNIRDDEGEDGSVPDVVPYYRYGHRPADPSWSAAFPQVTFVLYKYYGDLRAVRDNYDALKRYFKNIASQIPSSGLAHMAGRYGDWCILKPPNPVPTSFTSAFSYIENLEQFVEMARAIGESADAVAYADMVAQLKQDYFKAFWNGTHYCTPQITS
ncbi:alpha-L-rhamnosidase-like [Oscarella lobularis]|uniref:alpha-L-rhamnosidase-like n=1 Tax=Oscarella lobularis TaxID=121494 RepID=UPI00331424BA